MMYCSIIEMSSLSETIVPLSLHSIFALNPASDVSAPSQWSHEATKDVIPLDPRSTGYGTGLLLENTGLNTAVDANTQQNSGDHTQQLRWHFGHEWTQNLGRWVFTLPVHAVFFRRHVKWSVGSNESGSSNRRRKVGGWNKGRCSHDVERDKYNS